MALLYHLLILVSIALAWGQRPSFAGTRPIGYPELENKTTTEGLGNRYGESDDTTPRLPIEAQGNKELVDRLSKLPIDKQPFWLINWQALEEHRKNPQTYPQKPNPFVDPPSDSGNPIVRAGESNSEVNVNNRNNSSSVEGRKEKKF